MRKIVMAVGLAALLSGCGDERPASLGQEPFHIAQVEALGPTPPNVTNDQLLHLRDQTQALAAIAPETANPRLLRIRIMRLHEKDPGMSFLVGDSNQMEVAAEIFSMDGTRMASVKATVISEVMLNGIVGAAIAANSKTDDIKRDLDAKAANATLEKVYGSKAWKSWRKRR